MRGSWLNRTKFIYYLTYLENLPRYSKLSTYQLWCESQTVGHQARLPHLTDGATESFGRTLALSHMASPEAEGWLWPLQVSCLLSQPQGFGCDMSGAKAFQRGQLMEAAWLMGGWAGQARRHWVLGGRGGALGRAEWGPAPYRKLSSASARGPGQLGSGSHSRSASGSTGDSDWGRGSGSSWGSRGLSQEMVEEVLTSFRVELEGEDR